MKCGVCGATLSPATTDLPFKTSDHTIIILKGVPVWQCGNCSDYLLEDAVMVRVDEILATVPTAAELEVIRYAA